MFCGLSLESETIRPPGLSWVFLLIITMYGLNFSFCNAYRCTKRRNMIDRQLKSVSISFNRNNALTGTKTNKTLAQFVTFPAKLWLKVFLSCCLSDWLSSDYLSFRLLSTLTVRYLYLYYLETRYFRPLAIGVQSHFILTWHFWFPAPQFSFANSWEIVPSAPTIIDITITFVFHRFFGSLARSKYLLSFHFLSFSLCGS